MKRIFSLFLLAIMLFTASCSSETVSDDTTAIDTTTVETTTEPENPEPELPYTDYNGENLMFMIRDRNAYVEKYVYAEAEVGEVVNDAVYTRNRQTEERFNIKIEMTPYADIDQMNYANDIEKLVASGDESIDVFSYNRVALFQVGISGCLSDWNDVNYINFDAPYWDSNAAEQLLINDKLYLTANDISMQNLSGAYITYYNNNLVSSYNLDYPPDLVDANQWTIDKFSEMIRSVSKDLDGNGVYDHNDLYGFLSYESAVNGTIDQALAGFGIDYVKKNDDGSLSLANLDDRIVTLCDKFYNLLTQENVTLSYEQIKKTADLGDKSIYTYARSLFAAGQFLFTQTTLSGISEFDNMEDDFGIIPNPKFDENQENYYSRPDKYSLLFAIPITAKDLDKIGEVLEYMAWVSHDTVLPAYYEVNLKVKKNRDERASDMLDTIRDSIFYSISPLLNLGVESVVYNGFKRSSVVSSYDSAKSGLEGKLTKINESIISN